MHDKNNNDHDNDENKYHSIRAKCFIYYFSEYESKRSNFNSDLDKAVTKTTGQIVTMLEVKSIMFFGSGSRGAWI